MRFSICSYSFHRTAAAGDMDIFKYIDWNKEHGFSQLDPWMKHMELGFEDDAYIAKVKAAGDAAGLPFGCVAVDGGHIYEPTAEKRAANRKVAKRWIDICQQLDAEQVRIDAGGREETLDQIFDIVVEGYNELVAYARARGVEVIMENHWGPTKHPDNTVKVLDAVDGLGLLFDSYNWPESTHERAWQQYAKYARLTHFKTFAFDANGNEPDWNIPHVISILKEAGYNGAWGIESTPNDGREADAALRTLALLKRTLE